MRKEAWELAPSRWELDLSWHDERKAATHLAKVLQGAAGVESSLELDGEAITVAECAQRALEWGEGTEGELHIVLQVKPRATQPST